MQQKTIGILVGSLRQGSFSKQIAGHLAGLLSAAFDICPLDISQLVLYNQDLDSAPPPAWQDFRAQVRALDGVLFVTPEYNRSIPPVLKNAMDIASRPYGVNAWSGKPGGVISVSPGALGGFGANHHLRQVAACLNIFLMQQPEAYIGNIAKAFDAGDRLVDEGIRGFLQKFASAYTDWVNRFY
ncbi:MAG: NAD(P)H-dependent oxidoreductase [Oscillospiraceae bacterium]|jgi:chromate reductase|nr:NAD(P)H-dependent oxidoreductase [Oscillospiraceae bacterium]